MQKTDYDSENFYETEAIRRALYCLKTELDNKKKHFDFNLYEVDPRAYYTVFGPAKVPNPPAGIVLGFDKLFFFDNCPITVRYDIDKYAVIKQDFSIKYPKNIDKLKGSALDLAYILRNKAALDIYISAVSGLYYNRLDIADLVESLKFKNQNEQLDIIRDIPEHEKLINPVFPEDEVKNFIADANKMLSKEYQIDYTIAKDALVKYWSEKTDIEHWSPRTDLEICLIGNKAKIRSICEKIIIF